LGFINEMKSILIASFATIFIQPIIFCIWFLGPLLLTGKAGVSDIVEMFSDSLIVYILAITIIILLIIGLPIFFALRKINKLNAKYLITAGFLIGALPVLFLSYPVDNPGNGASYGGNWHGIYVRGMIDGVHTKYAWYIYIEKVIGFGVHGLIAAFVFFRVWSKYEKPEQSC